MADNLGPGSYNSSQLAIDMMISEMNDLELQRIKNSETEQLMHKYSSNEIAEIHFEYDQEINQVRNEMKNLDDKTGSEYQDLLNELDELKDERDAKLEVIEQERKDQEEKYGQQDTNLETRYEALKNDKEGLEKAQEEDIKGQ